MSPAPAAILRAAFARLSDPDRWHDGRSPGSAVDAQGEPLEPDDPRAARWCGVAALGLAAQGAPPEVAGEAGRLLDEACGDWMGAYNDRSTHPEVVAAFQNAIPAADRTAPDR